MPDNEKQLQNELSNIIGKDINFMLPDDNKQYHIGPEYLALFAGFILIEFIKGAVQEWAKKVIDTVWDKDMTDAAGLKSIDMKDKSQVDEIKKAYRILIEIGAHRKMREKEFDVFIRAGELAIKAILEKKNLKSAGSKANKIAQAIRKHAEAN